jgi:rRNA maturation protein Nop10
MGKCAECGEYHVFIKNKPCVKCGSVHNKSTKISGFTTWDDYGVYRIKCGNEACGHTWEFEQEE